MGKEQELDRDEYLGDQIFLDQILRKINIQVLEQFGEKKEAAEINKNQKEKN